MLHVFDPLLQFRIAKRYRTLVNAEPDYRRLNGAALHSVPVRRII
jgi:hypothetical protein